MMRDAESEPVLGRRLGWCAKGVRIRDFAQGGSVSASRYLLSRSATAAAASTFSVAARLA